MPATPAYGRRWYSSPGVPANDRDQGVDPTLAANANMKGPFDSAGGNLKELTSYDAALEEDQSGVVGSDLSNGDLLLM